MSAKFTPGPWYPYKNSAGGWEVMTLRDADFMSGEHRGHIGYAHGASICMGIGDHTESRTRGNEEANARLIASAPDLLAAAQKMMDYADSDYVPNHAFDILHAAIAKATGEPA